MEHHDTSQRFIIDNCAIRGEWCLLGSTFQTVISKRDYPMEIQRLLGEMMAAAVLLSSTLKFEGRLTLQARGEGILQLATAECTNDKKVRAIARWNGDVTGLSFTQLLKSAHMAITIEPTNGKSYQGIVPLEHDNLGQCLEFYFQQSEQLNTRIWLHQGNNKAAGLMVQVLPYNSTDEAEQKQNNEQQQEEDWTRIVALANTITAEEHLAIPAPELLHRLYNEETVRLFDATNVEFTCSCSRQKMGKALLAVGQPEVSKILLEQDKITMNCEFCNSSHTFDKVDIQGLFELSPIENDGNTH